MTFGISLDGSSLRFVNKTSWNPVAPLGMPHRLMEDDIYRNFFIPKGTTVLANI